MLFNGHTELLIIAGALFSGWVVTGWVLLRRNRALGMQLAEQEAAQRNGELHLQHLRQSLDTLAQEKDRLEQRFQDSERRAQEWQRRGERLSVLAGEQQRQREQLHNERQTLEERLQQLQQRHEELRVEHSTLQSTLQHRQQHFDEQQQLLRESREQLKLEFEQLAGRIFEAKGQTFTQTSQQSLDALLKPFREQIDQFRSKVEDIHHKDTQQQAALTQELLQLKQLNQQITREAHDLSTALRGQKKTQGNWGELILENVLERSGLRAGIDFKREVSLLASDGQRQRPDVLVYLPQDKHLIIDAKVSLNAYTRYINSEDETERQLALAEHVQAFSQRIRELSDRNYFDLPSLNAPEMVFMFVPIESAFVEALKADESLFQKAIEQNVLVATPTTLLTSLNIVRQLWRFEDQNRHTAELAERAGRIHDKLRTFLGSMDSIGSSLERATEAWQRACSQLVSGRGNLVKQINDFKELGVSVKSELGEHWTERAELELGVDEALMGSDKADR
ncbi:MAG: DNA recombination protein RmuC [Gammaproteobacteria bacterium]|nr:DNA recombination protein RmuC [Gammaproteobacteria bacterium]